MSTTPTCDRDCFNCKYGGDCILPYDYITQEERELSNNLDKYAKEIKVQEPEVSSHKKACKKWYEKNKDKIKKKDSVSVERRRELNRKWHEAHKKEDNERTLANYYANYEENKRKARDRKRERYQANKEYYREKQREYRRRKKEMEQNADIIQ